MAIDYDVIVVGAGPGGYVAAIRAAQLGLKTAVVEKEEVGGVCTNWGCIPSKALLKNAEVVNLIRRSKDFGVSVENASFDIAAAVDRSRKVVDRMINGVKFLLKKNKIDLLMGQAYLASANRVEIKTTGQVLNTRNIIVATGARPKNLPGLEADGKLVLTSKDALALRSLPKSIVIVGAGAVGVEFAYFYRSYGSEVALVEMLPRVVPNEDEEISKHLAQALSRQGIKVFTGAKVARLEKSVEGARALVSSAAGDQWIDCDRVLLGVGVQANTDGLGLEGLGVGLERGFIKVDEHLATGVPGVYAIGDVTGKLLLAHVASAQGIAAAEAIVGKQPKPLRYEDMPRATYCQPQVASVGLTEAQARERGHQVKVGKFPFTASGKAVAMGETEGLVKVVADAKFGEILGAHLIGHDVTELLGELTVTKNLEGTALDVGRTVHAHPSLSEAVMEAALATSGESITI